VIFEVFGAVAARRVLDRRMPACPARGCGACQGRLLTVPRLRQSVPCERQRKLGGSPGTSPPPDPPANIAPAGYYLAGLLVAPAYRRRGIGERLTRARMAWVALRGTETWFFANAANRASLLLHQGLGFREVTRDFTYPGVTFTGGVGVLCRASLTR
jgi:ribosomal protein S18 acetylase RimI-like enzyme